MAKRQVLPMRNLTMKSWPSGEQWLLGCMVLALGSAACIWLLLSPVPMTPAYLAAVALLIASLLASLFMMRLVGSTSRRMEAVLHDRTKAERHAIEALRDSEARWKEMFEHNPVMYFMVDAAGTVMSVNSFGAAQLGYSVSELLGQSVLRVFLDEDREMVQNNVAVCLGQIGQTHSWEIRKIRKDGSILWVRENAKAVRRQDDQLIVLIACEDITERKEAEHALQQSEMYLAEAQRLSLTGSFGWRVADGEIIWSAETFRIFGYERTPSVMLESVVQRIHPDDRERVQQTYRRAPREGKDFEHEFRLLMPDGSVKYLRATAHAVIDASGIEFVGAVTDITARKRAAAELHEARANLARVTRATALGQLTASIAHEVNQPLAAVVVNAAACLRWLDRDPPDVKEARDTVRSIIKDGNRASDVIERIRALVTRTAEQKTCLDLNEAINEVIRLGSMSCSGTGYRCGWSFRPPFPLLSPTACSCNRSSSIC